jgi:hypothetical protein
MISLRIAAVERNEAGVAGVWEIRRHDVCLQSENNQVVG